MIRGEIKRECDHNSTEGSVQREEWSLGSQSSFHFFFDLCPKGVWVSLEPPEFGLIMPVVLGLRVKEQCL